MSVERAVSRRGPRTATYRRVDSLAAPTDPTLATAILLLLAIGLVAVYSAGIMRSEQFYDSTSRFLTAQMASAVIGLAMMYAMSRIPIRAVERFAVGFGILTLVILALVLIPGIGVTVSGARRWLDLGPLPRFQPSEFARLAVVLIVARYAARNYGKLHSLAAVGKSLVLPLLFAGLILLEPDLDTGMMVLFLGLIVLFAAGLPWIYILGLIGVGVAATALLILDEPYRLARMLGFLDPWGDPRGKGYHIIQGWIAMGSGGFFGKGLGDSIQKMGFLPEPHTDFIFAVIGEEGGFVATTVIVLLFAVLTWRGYKVAVAHEEPFSRCVAAGITAMVTLQALLNLMVVTGLAPTTGVPLPLISYGGTSLVITLTSLGILLGLSRHMHGESGSRADASSRPQTGSSPR